MAGFITNAQEAIRRKARDLAKFLVLKCPLRLAEYRVAQAYGISAGAIPSLIHHGLSWAESKTGFLPTEDEVAEILADFLGIDVAMAAADMKVSPQEEVDACWDEYFRHRSPESSEDVAGFYADVFLRSAFCYGLYFAYCVRPRYLIAEIFESVRGDERVLDYGCGQAPYSLLLAQMGCQVDLLDVDAEWRHRWWAWYSARLGGVAYRFLPHTSTLPRDYYDIVICLDVLEHLTHPWPAFISIHKALKIGGRLLFNAPFGVGRLHLKMARDEWNAHSGWRFIEHHYERQGGWLFVKKRD